MNLVCLHQHLIFSSLDLVDLGETFSKARFYSLKNRPSPKKNLLIEISNQSLAKFGHDKTFSGKNFRPPLKPNSLQELTFVKADPKQERAHGEKFRREALETV